MTKRVTEIDFTKCVMILLMIAFHLVYIGDTYSGAKAFVYTFHMPAFLIISGYLLNMEKGMMQTVRSMMWIALPYAIMETAYIIGAAILPIREHIDDLTITGYLDRLILHPIGPYWYLHTLVICSLVCRGMVWGMERLGNKFSTLSVLLMAGALWAVSMTKVTDTILCLYFVLGVALRNTGTRFTDFFQGKWFMVVVFAAMAICANHERYSVGGFIIVYTAIGTSVKLHSIMAERLPGVKDACLFIGRNTLLLLLFSPIFTVLAKTYQPYILSIEPTGMLFMCVSVAIAVAGSIAIGWVLDAMSLSRWIFGRAAVNK